MNRTEEYNALLQELEKTPAPLNFTVARAKSKTRRQKLRRAFGIPAAALAAVCACFVLLVNVSAPFAAACADLPLLKGLAEAVSFSSSLSAAVANDWVQPIGLAQSADGVEMTIEYVIVDQKQLNIFYTLKGDPEADYQPYASVSGTDGAELPCATQAGSARANGELYQITADFTSAETMPDQLRLECDLRIHLGYREESEPVGTFTFDLSFDPKFTAQATVIELNQWLKLDGQRVLLKNVEIYPTHMRINLEDGPDNTAWLRGLALYAEDEHGAQYGSSNGITSTGSPDTPFTNSFWLDSSFFSESEHLTLYITGAEWLEKDKQWTWVDLNTGETGFLPDGVSLLSFSQKGEDVSLAFRIPAGSRSLYNPFLRWRVPGGEENYIGSWGGGTARDLAENGGPKQDLEGYSDIDFLLQGCSGGRVELALDFTRETVFDPPVKITLS